ATRSSAPGTRGGLSGRSTATPAREIHAAGTRGTAACRRARRGCARTGVPRRRRGAIEWPKNPYSPVARRAARELHHVRDLVFLHEPLAEVGVVGRPLVGHVEDLVAGADVLVRMAVAVQAPPHLEAVFLERERHLVHAAVTR